MEWYRIKMIHWLLLILFLFFHSHCNGEKPSAAKPNYLSLPYAFSKAGIENDNTSIADHNKLQNQISVYREIYNDALGLYKSKKYLDSVSKYEEAMNVFVEAETYYHYGKSLMSIGKFSEAIKAYEISDALDYENKINLYYNLACAYSLSTELESSAKYLQLSIQKGFKHFNILEQDSNLSFVRKNPKWKQILINLTSDKHLTKNPKDFITNQNKKLKLKSNSKIFIYGTKEEDRDNIELELFEGIAFYREEITDKDGFLTVITREGSYRVAKDSLQIELKKGRKETNHPSETVKTNLELSTVQPISFELIYKESLNGFMKNDFVIYGDDTVYALDKKACAYIKDEEKIECGECKKQYEQKGYFCAY
ncbi:MAG TPA: hypothetical protein PLX69_12100 [Leptospiraceae bacterium]|nr:hypothetical protein [Leptospiraceae bacterium]HRG75293.1 hypothetical protein [Leptospiraceae bacterium]